MEENRAVTSFKIGGEFFAFETQAIRHILEFTAPTRVPLTKPFFKGIINNHGNMIPVVDFIVVAIETGGKEELCGFKVDEMDDVFEYEASDFKREVVIDVNDEVQHAVAGTIKVDDKFVYLLKTAELANALT